MVKKAIVIRITAAFVQLVAVTTGIKTAIPITAAIMAAILP